MLGKGAFEQFEAEAGEAVAVGDHNPLDTTCFDGVQKGEESAAMEVEAGCDVGEDARVGWGVGPEGVELTVEVAGRLLLGAGDASVKNCLTSSCLTFFAGGSLSEGPAKVLFMVAMGGELAVANTKRPDFPRLRPPVQCQVPHTVALVGNLGSNVPFLRLLSVSNQSPPISGTNASSVTSLAFLK